MANPNIFRRFPSDDLSCPITDGVENDEGQLYFADRQGENAEAIAGEFFEADSTVTLTNVGGIASAEAHGTAGVMVGILLVSVATGEAFGVQSCAAGVVVVGVVTAEAHGVPVVVAVLVLVGIEGAEAFGDLNVAPYEAAAAYPICAGPRGGRSGPRGLL